MARTKSPAKLLLLASVAISLAAAACVFGGGDAEPTPMPTEIVPERPATGRSGPEPTATPIGGVPTVRPTLPPPPTAIPSTPSPAQSPLEGRVSVVYSNPFIWPAEGPITSFMSPQHPNGIDIGLNGGSMEVRAAAGGTVTFSGGSDNEALGISITIDHGNGISTTYGHLSSMRITQGQTVEIGQIIGIGGSTGISTGNHLHFEVRKNGETVDPLHVLPSTDADTLALDVDCATTPFTLPSGSLALINFAGLLGEGQTVVDVSAQSRSGGPTLSAAIANATEVRLQSPIDFDGPNGVDSYNLEVTIDNATENEVLTCGFVVQRRSVPTTFYVRAAPPEGSRAQFDDEGHALADDEIEEPAGSTGSEPGAGTSASSEPAPTATPNPWAGTPNYTVPTPVPYNPGGASGGGGSGGAPGYGPPSGAQPPSYGIPTQ